MNGLAGGTALKPSFEPIIIARKPFRGSLVDNVIEWGVGGINIDECRIDLEDTYKYKETNRQARTENTVFDNNHSGFRSENNNIAVASPDGRFPANTILTYDETDFDEVCGGFPETKSGGGDKRLKNGSSMFFKNSSSEVSNVYEANEGSASRYFYCAKASKKDRDEGLNEFELKQKVFNGKSNQSSTDMKDVEQRFTTEGRNIHPTVKPVELMQYLVRLVTPKGGIILDPFMGSGSTGKATMYENKERRAKYKFIGIELSSEYAKIAEARIGYAIEDYYDYSSENATMENIQNNIGKKVKTSDKVLLW